MILSMELLGFLNLKFNTLSFPKALPPEVGLLVLLQTMKNLFFLSCFFLCSTFHVFGQDVRDKKVLFIILDGITADNLERVHTPYLDQIAKVGGYARAFMGGEAGTYTETPTISAVGYNSLLTGTWVNKHNVFGNGIEDPNYNYWTVFKFLRESRPSSKLAVFSTWEDNRTKLIGEGLPQTGGLRIDRSFDGFELDSLMFPHDKQSRYILNIDNYVSFEAAYAVKTEAPDLTWVYLQYTDDIGHRFGDSPNTDLAIQLADQQVGRIWESIQYRELQHKEDWMIFITTDHGRTQKDGKGHGKQSERERTIWMVTNLKGLNDHFFSGNASMVDIAPTILRYLELEIPTDRVYELDGIPLIGEYSFTDVKLEEMGGENWVTWNPGNSGGLVKIGFSEQNDFKDSGKADPVSWIGEVSVTEGKYKLPVELTSKSFFKLVLEGNSNTGNVWKTVEQ